MNICKADRFLADAEHYYRWYLTRPDLLPDVALELAEEFLDAVEQTLYFLLANPVAREVPNCDPIFGELWISAFTLLNEFF